MGAWDVQRRLWSRRLSSELVLSVMVLRLLCSGSFVKCTTLDYCPLELAALKTIFGAWKNTPNQDTNLAGWSSKQDKPCESMSDRFATIPNWRGIQCLRTVYNYTDSSSQVEIIGLSLSNASIAGVLPPDVGTLTSLYVLELIGNPNLTGPLPSTLGNTWLNVLDVHDNDLSGPIPDLYGLWNLLQLDLSGNNFTGEFDFSQFSSMDYLQILSIGNNFLTGEIPRDVFKNKTKLEKLDISDNNFTGALPDLNPMQTYLNYLDVSGNQFEGPVPDLKSFTALRHVNLSRNRFFGKSLDILNLTPNTPPNTSELAIVDLSHNCVTGPLSSWDASIQQVGTIRELYLDNNFLSGTLDIPKLFELGLLQNKNSASNSTGRLKILSLSNNKIERVIYDSDVITNVTTIIRLDGNPYCTANYDSKNDGQRCYCTQICYVTSPQLKIVIIVATTSVVGVVLIFLVVVGAMLYKSRRYERYLLVQFEKKFEEFDVKPTIFPYSELRAATRDFHEDMKLGQGGYGAVYKGVLSNGNVVAVKQLYVKTAQGLDEFLNEVVLITGMKHRNLVNLKGCCLRENQRLLVYEYVDNYDVDQILLGSRRDEVVSWPLRLKMCLGVARGLHYLHELAHPRVIHRDIKAGNVLLDKNLAPKIAGFGLVLLFPDEQTHIMTVHVAGTKGYLAPEYASLGQLSDKVDVYSFGLLCLEIISGRRNIDETLPVEQLFLSKWAWQLHEENRLKDLVDPTLQLSDEEVQDVQRVINLSLLCIQTAAEKRPTMARIVSILQSDTESEVQVLQGAGKGKRPSYESLKSQKSVEYRNTSLESVTEVGNSSLNGYHAKSHGAQDSLVGGVQLSEIVAR